MHDLTYSLTLSQHEKIVDAINTLSTACEEVVVTCEEGGSPSISIVIHDATLFERVTSLGRSLSINN